MLWTIGILLTGVVIGAGLVVVFSKNNKNTIAASREKILEAAKNGENELKKLLDSMKS